MTKTFEKGPIVYRGGHHYTTCDSDGWHRNWATATDEYLGLVCRCKDWVGGCPNKMTEVHHDNQKS